MGKLILGAACSSTTAAESLDEYEDGNVLVERDADDVLDGVFNDDGWNAEASWLRRSMQLKNAVVDSLMIMFRYEYAFSSGTVSL